MTVEFPDFTVTLDFVMPDVENVRQAVNDGAVTIDDVPAAEFLARLEAEAAEGIHMGDDNTIIGDVTLRSMGSGNTIVGATDDRGNTILNRGGTAIGRGARADSTSIAIGAGAGAGNGALLTLLAELENGLRAEGETEDAWRTVEVFDAVRSNDASRARRVWGAIKVAATLEELAALVARITPLIHHL